MPKTSSARKRHITLIGAGNLATAIGPALRSAGYQIDAVAGRALPASRKRAAALARKLGGRLEQLDEIEPLSGILWLCHTDDALAETAALLVKKSGWQGKIVRKGRNGRTRKLVTSSDPAPASGW